ncbi:MAG: tetratricopeptide repeat protein, partial [Candidatus Gastranaerophilales bacterium]|nr:tetratricopeptide repeat protein [Candidatus Gastranaerophilales bacterium]
EKNPEYAYNLASAYFLNGWFDETIKYFNLAICLSPENVNYHYSLAYLYYQKKLYDKALKELDFIKKINPKHSMSIILNAMITAKKGDLLNAKNQLENIVKNNDDDFAFYALSQIYKELRQLDLAKKMIERAIELNPDSLNYLSELVEIEIEQKDYKNALRLANKILKINDKYVFACISVAKIYLELKDFGKLYDMAQEIIQLDSNSPEGYYYNAMALFEQGDKGFAIESMKKSISLDLNNAMLYEKMSEFYQDIGDFKTAYDWAKEAGLIDERNYKYKWLCAKLAVTLHKEEEALKNYSKSYRLASFDKDLCEEYANYLKSIGRKKQAEKILQN